MAGYLTIRGFRATSTNPKYPNSIEVLSFSFPPGNGRQAQAISVVKPTDSSSPLLFKAVSQGTWFHSAVLEWWGNYSDSPAPATSLIFLKLTMTDVIVVNLQRSGNLEACSIGFRGMHKTYGAIPAPQTTVQPSHQHLINRIAGVGKQP
jgi:type VI protein secretion system component Hcp